MIGVVGPDDRVGDLASSLDDLDVAAGGAGAVLEGGPDVAVAIGEAAASALLRAGSEVPILPVDAGRGLESVPIDRAPAVLRDGVEAGFHTRGRPVLEASVGEEPCGRGLFDVTFVTSDPARISEYAVATGGWSERFRADGVVVATPAGSDGYARAVGGPVLDPTASALVVVPVAAFALRSSVRVVDGGSTLAISVERDEVDVSLLVDDQERRRVPPRRTVTVEATAAVETVVDPGPRG